MLTELQLLPLKSREATLTRIIDLIPSILDLLKDMKSRGQKKDEEEDKEVAKGKAKAK